MRFARGQVVATPGALQALEKAEQLPAAFLDRHVNGDWGEVPEADKQENAWSVAPGFRILSAYTTSAGDRIWILTEADRSATTIVLPDEYRVRGARQEKKQRPGLGTWGFFVYRPLNEVLLGKVRGSVAEGK